MKIIIKGGNIFSPMHGSIKALFFQVLYSCSMLEKEKNKM